MSSLTPLKTFSICSSSSVRRSEEHTSELQSQSNLVCRLLLEKKIVPEQIRDDGGPPRVILRVSRLHPAHQIPPDMCRLRCDPASKLYQTRHLTPPAHTRPSYP